MTIGSDSLWITISVRTCLIDSCMVRTWSFMHLWIAPAGDLSTVLIQAGMALPDSAVAASWRTGADLRSLHDWKASALTWYGWLVKVREKTCTCCFHYQAIWWSACTSRGLCGLSVVNLRQDWNSFIAMGLCLESLVKLNTQVWAAYSHCRLRNQKVLCRCRYSRGCCHAQLLSSGCWTSRVAEVVKMLTNINCCSPWSHRGCECRQICYRSRQWWTSYLKILVFHSLAHLLQMCFNWRT